LKGSRNLRFMRRCLRTEALTSIELSNVACECNELL
jgi:hypothetical protein